MGNLDILGRIRQAAADGDAFAQFELGLDLDFGTLGEQNFEKAADYLTKAADQGHQSAEGNLLLQHVLGQANVPTRRALRSVEESSGIRGSRGTE